MVAILYRPTFVTTTLHIDLYCIINENSALVQVMTCYDISFFCKTPFEIVDSQRKVEQKRLPQGVKFQVFLAKNCQICLV